MSNDAQVNLQKTIYTALTGDSQLSAAVTGVYDHVPAMTAFPYVTIGDTTVLDWSTKSNNGQEHTFVIHVWTQAEGVIATKTIAGHVYRILHEAALSVTGFNTLFCRCEFQNTLRDPDGFTKHEVMRFRVITTE